MTRTQAVRKLQISLPDFRRLCIFKGIYPREPRNKKKAAKSSTPAATFYYTRDIQYLLHEPLLQKFREQKALAKKIGRLLGRNEVKDAARVEKTLAPRMTLDHIVKERYPTFVDALRDLDDCLCMLYLFANLPSTTAVPAKTVALCQRLTLEFEHYLIVSHALRKSFLSIKGIYYQATIQGQDILWLVPYKFVQRTTGDIDFRIMGTFVEFYTTLLGFVNFRLYTSVGLVYPPKFDQSREDAGAELGAFTLEGRAVDDAPDLSGRTMDTSTQVEQKTITDAAAAEKAQKAANALSASAAEPNAEADEDDEPVTATIDEFTPAAEGADILAQPTQSLHIASTLFSPFVFYLSRETPRAPLEFLLKAFGCKRVGWDSVLGDGAWTSDEQDTRITHQVVDRPVVSAENGGDEGGVRGRVAGRTYVQPQWVWDCANAGKLLRPDLYAPGATLPPHLSPWGRVKRGGYDPTKPLDVDDDAPDAVAPATPVEDEVPAITNDDDDADDDELDDMAVAPEDADDALSDSDADAPAADDFAGFSSDEEDNLQRELAAEARGLPVPARTPEPTKQADVRRKKAQQQRHAQAEELERQKMMLPRRKRKLLEKMMYSNARTDEETQRLVAKRRRLEKAAAAL